MNARTQQVLSGLFISSTLMGASIAQGQSISATIHVPSMDRWNYPFASTPGAEVSAPSFAAIRQAGFDDRDAQFLIGFDTSLFVPAGYGGSRYLVSSVTVSVFVSTDLRFEYDPSFDSVATSYDLADPDYVVDSDLGKPVEIFPVGYRNGFTDQTYLESSPYSPFPSFPPREGVRNAFPAALDANGVATDISRHVRQKFEAQPIGIGTTPLLTPGELVPAGTELTFTIDLTQPQVRNYLANGLNAGQVRFMISGLHATSGGPGGGTGSTAYPTFFTKENALSPINGFSPRLQVQVSAFPGADFNRDGGVDGSDVEAFFTAWESGEEIADFNMDGGVEGSDIEAFFVAWENG